MSALSKINHALDSLNQTNLVIAQYILEHPEEVTQISVQALAQKTNTSPAAIVRFSKYLGYQGFPQLKLDLAVDVRTETITQLDDQPLLDSTFEAFLKAEQNSYLNTVQSTFRLINSHRLKQAIEDIKSARKVYLIGSGMSGIICQDFLIKLTQINIPAIYYWDSHLQLANSIHLGQEDLIIAISFHGRNANVNQIVRNAVKQHTKVIAITQNINSTLAKYSDIVLAVPLEENEFRFANITFRTASQILIDLLYLGVVRDNRQEASKDLIAARDLLADFYKHFK